MSSKKCSLQQDVVGIEDRNIVEIVSRDDVKKLSGGHISRTGSVIGWGQWGRNLE